MAEELTDAAAAELAGLAERATKGPWSVLVEETHKDHWRMRIPEIGAAFPVHKVDDREIGNAINDVAYIAAACNLSPALLAERQRLRAEVERLTRELHRTRRCFTRKTPPPPRAPGPRAGKEREARQRGGGNDSCVKQTNST